MRTSGVFVRSVVFVFILTLLWEHRGESAGSSCPAECVCRWKSGKETVECVQKGLTTIPIGMSTSTQVLDFHGNSLLRLPSDFFRSSELLNLQRIYLAQCRIEEVEDDAFSKLTNLVELDLSLNQLSVVPSATFKDFPELRRLLLSGNPITRLEDNAFNSLTALTSLELSKCHIEAIAPRAFQGLHTLAYLKLDGNHLNALTARTLSPLKGLHGVDLHENPWKCDCSMQDVQLWLNRYKIPYIISPTCASPHRLHGRLLVDLPLEELACPPRGIGIAAVSGYGHGYDQEDNGSAMINSPDTASLSDGGSHTNRDPLLQPPPPHHPTNVASTQAPLFPYTAYLGYNATLHCKVIANPEPRVQWFRRGQLLGNLTRFAHGLQTYVIHERGTTEKTSVLTVTGVSLDDAGVYTCLADNRGGSWTANFSLRVGIRDLEASGLSGGEIAGISFGLLLLGAAVLLLICVLLTKWRRRSSHHEIKQRPPNNVTSNSLPSNASGVSTNAASSNSRKGFSPHAKFLNSVNHIDLRLGKLRAGGGSAASSRASMTSSVPRLSQSSSVEKGFSDEASDSDKTLIDSSASPCRLSDKPDVVMNVGRSRERCPLVVPATRDDLDDPPPKSKKDRKNQEKRAQKDRKKSCAKDENMQQDVPVSVDRNKELETIGRHNSHHAVCNIPRDSKDETESLSWQNNAALSCRCDDGSRGDSTICGGFPSPSPPSPTPSSIDWITTDSSVFGSNIIIPDGLPYSVSENTKLVGTIKREPADGTHSTVTPKPPTVKEILGTNSRFRNYVPVLPPLPAQHFARVRNSLVEPTTRLDDV